MATLVAGGTAILCMALAVLAGLAAEGTRDRARALLVAMVALAAAPMMLGAARARAFAPGEGAVFAAATLLLSAATLCLWRLRGVAGAGLAARGGIGACLAVWLMLFLLWSGIA